MNPQAVVFDLDGTLIDSAADIAAAANAALADLGRAPREEAEVRGFIGDGVARLMERCLGGDGPVEDAVRAFRAHYAAGCLVRTEPFPGVPELLADLPIPLAVLSNKPEAFCRRILHGLGLEDRFVRVAGGDTFADRKPAPGPLTETLSAMGFAPAAGVVVGDGWQDMAAARAAGAAAIGVLWGQGTADALEDAGADRVVSDVPGLRDALGLAD